MLYLVTGLVKIQAYMQDDYSTEEEIRLVEASDEGQAEYKFTQHFESMTSGYAVYYSVLNVYATSTII